MKKIKKTIQINSVTALALHTHVYFIQGSAVMDSFDMCTRYIYELPAVEAHYCILYAVL